jgi:beta-aspartyl-peptidase (threonine type)
MYALVVHGGAGSRSERGPALTEQYRAGLAAALRAGQRLLEAGGSALDAVEAAVAALEDDPLFNAGRGAVLTVDGTAELNAAIMDGMSLRAGAVAQVRRVKNPVRLARRVLEQLPHVFLVGEAADAYAAECGLTLVPNEYFITAERRAQLAARAQSRAQGVELQTNADQQRQPARGPHAHPRAALGTVGAVARDERGNLAAATSTGGTLGQRSGRIGDSPIIGAGTYADDECCAISTTGHGEAFMRTVLAYDIAARVRYRGDPLALAVEQAINERLTLVSGLGGVIAVDARGDIVVRHNAAAMAHGHVTSNLELQITV